MSQQCYLMPSDPNDPCGRNYKGSVSSDRASLFNLLQHEAGHFVVVLKKKGKHTIIISVDTDVDIKWIWLCKEINNHVVPVFNWAPSPNILTACLHQEQLMATISLLWNANFCWKPYRATGMQVILGLTATDDKIKVIDSNCQFRISKKRSFLLCCWSK